MYISMLIKLLYRTRWRWFLPSVLGNDHLSAGGVEGLPEVRVHQAQLDAALFLGACLEGGHGLTGSVDVVRVQVVWQQERHPIMSLCCKYDLVSCHVLIQLQ